MDIEVFEQRLEQLDKDALVTFVIRRQHQFSPEEKEVVQRLVSAKLPPDVWQVHVEKLRRDGVDLTPLHKPNLPTQKTSGTNITFMLWLLVLSVVLGLGVLVYSSVFQ